MYLEEAMKYGQRFCFTASKCSLRQTYNNYSYYVAGTEHWSDCYTYSSHQSHSWHKTMVLSAVYKYTAHYCKTLYFSSTWRLWSV